MIKSDNPYQAYFVNQAKGKGYSQLGGSLPEFQGARMQRGSGLGSLFREFYRAALSFAKTRVKLLGTTLLDTGANILKDVAKCRSLGESVENRREQGGLELLNKVKIQMGGGLSRKRKQVIKDSDHSRSKQRRISDETKGITGVSIFKIIQPQPMQVYRNIFS